MNAGGAAEPVRTWFSPLYKDAFLQTKPGTSLPQTVRLPGAAVAGAACSLSDLKQFGWRALPVDDLHFAVFAARRPAWLDDWVNWLCEAVPHCWPFESSLCLRQGPCRAPRNRSLRPRYDRWRLLPHSRQAQEYRSIPPFARRIRTCSRMTYGVCSRSRETRNSVLHHAINTVGPTITGPTLWCDWPRSRNCREPAFLTPAWMRCREISLSSTRVGFRSFMTPLVPTPKRNPARTLWCLSCLAGQQDSTDGVARSQGNSNPGSRRQDRSQGSGQRDQTGAVESPGANRKWLALQLLEQTARKHPELMAKVATPSAEEALAHESPDGQMRLSLLEKYASPMPAELARALSERLDHVAASHRSRLQKLIAVNAPVAGEAPLKRRDENRTNGTQETTLRKRAKTLEKNWRALAGVDELLCVLEKDRGTIPALDLDPLAIPRLDPDRRIKPIEALDDLIDVFAHVLEEPDDPMEVERVLDGISRLCDQRPDDFAARTGPLRKRALGRLAKSVTGPFVGCGVLADLCGVARGWLCGDVVLPVKKGPRQHDESQDVHEYDNSKQRVEFFIYHLPTVQTFLSHRALAVAQRSAVGKAAPLLAAPTHAGGWIDAREVVRRSRLLESLNQEADPPDQIQALLRLAPDHRSNALKAARHINGEFGAALRYALGGNEKIGANPSLWVAAARARSPLADDATLERLHPGLGPDAGKVARHEASIQHRGKTKFQTLSVSVEPTTLKLLVAELVTVLMNPRPRGFNERYYVEAWETAADLRWMLTVWPMQSEGWFGRVLPRFADNLDWWEAMWPNRTLLEPLLDPDVPLKPMALLMLALGLAAKQPGENGLATDSLIAAIDDGRLDACKLGATMAFLAPMIKCVRLARTLSQAARVSPLHLQVVAQVIQSALRGDPAQAPRDLHALLELLKESLLELGASVSDAEARGYLEKIETGGKTIRLVRELLALEEKPKPSIRRQAVLRALEHRVVRAESWSRRVE